MSEFTSFLLARIAEDEAVARDLSDISGPLVKSRLVTEFDDDYANPVAIIIDPARVLAECAAKRAIMAAWRKADQMYGGDAGAFMDDTLRALASVYADHEDYRAEWAS